MEKIIFFDVEDYEREFLLNNCQGSYDYVFVEEPLNNLKPLPDEYLDAGIISCFTNSRLSEDVFSQFRELKLIALRSVGFNHVDIEFCKKHGIAVETTPASTISSGIEVGTNTGIITTTSATAGTAVISVSLTGHDNVPPALATVTVTV